MFVLFQNGHFALSITMCHLLFKFVAAGIVRGLMECRSEEPRVSLAWGSYVRRVALAGMNFEKLTSRSILLQKK